MKLLMIGSGGREHTLIRKLKESPEISQIYCAPGNGGIAQDAEKSGAAICVPISATDISELVKFAKSEQIDFVFVAPDDPLALGLVDAMEEAGIPAFGPRQNAAILESSKVFSKNLMKKYGIPTAAYESFDNSADALKYIKQQNEYPVVVKADGLALGKGVIIAQDYAQAEQAVRSIIDDKIFGASGNRVVIEEFLTGTECTVLTFTDGKTLVPMVSAKDHKPIFDGNNGPNTGGMGTISPCPEYTEEIAQWCMKHIYIPTMNAMNSEGRPFQGCIFFGLMILNGSVKVIEYNARFGDPETQVVIPRLKTDLFEIIRAVREGRLGEIEIEWNDSCTACVVLASPGYPGNYPKGLPISGLDKNGGLEGVTVIHAGTKFQDGSFLTNGGRVLGITAEGKTLSEALDRAYAGVEKVHFDGMQYRKDIGQ